MHCGNSEINIKENYTVIVAAAGSGKRMGLSCKKQFLEYKGKPLYLNSVIEAAKCSLVTDIIIVTGKNDVEIVKEHCEKHSIPKIQEVVCGGEERQDSIYNALKKVKIGFVAIQDGARPFLEEKYLCEGLETLKKDLKINGVVVGVKLKDTIKIVNEKKIIENTPQREFLYAAQTPQIFRTEILKKAYEEAFNKNFYGTDDSSLVEKLGMNVKIIEGSYKNIKITTIEDLKYLDEEIE